MQSYCALLRESVMAKGTVKWFDPKKGFGFLVNNDGIDVFVHHSQIQQEGFRCLRTGQVVNYNEVISDKGLLGTEITVVDDEKSDTIVKDVFADEIA